jgi:hypothetical protein
LLIKQNLSRPRPDVMREASNASELAVVARP